MTANPMFPRFDGLMTLSRREGVDIRPTLLRVLTDLYVQTPTHTIEEEQQFVELASRLIDQVDDATLAVVRARLSIYPRTPQALSAKLMLSTSGRLPTGSAKPVHPVDVAEPFFDAGHLPTAAAHTLSMQPGEASELATLFFAGNTNERILILRNLESSPLKAASRTDARRASRAVAALEQVALKADLTGFAAELAHALILPTRMARRIVEDPGGEALACALRALSMPGESFERVLLFLDPELGTSVHRVYRLSRLYDGLSERVSLIMLAAWRGMTLASSRVRYQPTLHDDERQRARAVSAHARPASSQALPSVGTPSRGTTNP